MQFALELKGFAGGKIFRAELFETVKFPEGFWFEDSVLSYIIFPAVKNAYVISNMVYIYRQHNESITHSFWDNPKRIDTYWITETLMREHRENGLPEDENYAEKCTHQFILNAKRIKNMPIEIQKSVFLLTCGLVREYSIRPVLKKYIPLYKAINDMDFGKYRLYCLTH